MTVAEYEQQVINDNKGCEESLDIIKLMPTFTEWMFRQKPEPLYCKSAYMEQTVSISLECEFIINKEIQQMLAKDIIQPVKSPYNSPVWVVPKKVSSMKMEHTN
ncbi:unnamed protein product [Ceratitis capitata]|uniref:(Mediterranean fruit fly) hypothetical protein n=1 Tax=Ceratitis capitata TaxID=7213 RepID=A0A811VDS0_CERCA|nr:unnamed protein product [Ceratitis capitata]